MPVFLSDAWFAALDDALAGVATSIDTPLTIEQRIESPGGSVAYALRFEGGRVRLDRAPHGDADVTFSQDRATALALARGVLAARTALSDGRLHVRGTPARLVDAVDALTEVAAATAALRADTVGEA